MMIKVMHESYNLSFLLTKRNYSRNIMVLKQMVERAKETMIGLKRLNYPKQRVDPSLTITVSQRQIYKSQIKGHKHKVINNKAISMTVT